MNINKVLALIALAILAWAAAFIPIFAISKDWSMAALCAAIAATAIAIASYNLWRLENRQIIKVSRPYDYVGRISRK